MLRRERKNTESKNARRMHGNIMGTTKKVVRTVKTEIAADMLALTAAMGSAAILNNSICGIINDAAKGYYDKRGITLAVKKHSWSKETLINSKELKFKPKSVRVADKGWWFDQTTCRKMTDGVAIASAVCGAVAGTATRGIVKDALKFHQDSEESWDSCPYYEAETAEE